MTNRPTFDQIADPAHRRSPWHSRHRNQPSPSPRLSPPAVQPSLLDDAWLTATTVTPAYDTGATLEERFLAFHRANPHVYQAMRRVALDARHNGMEQWSIWGVLAVVRWQVVKATQNDDGWKINNSFTPIYARLLMAREPELAGFFETRHTNLNIDYILRHI